MDYIFSLVQLNEKKSATNNEVHLLFVNVQAQSINTQSQAQTPIIGQHQCNKKVERGVLLIPCSI